jgi:rhomboid protease GluP
LNPPPPPPRRRRPPTPASRAILFAIGGAFLYEIYTGAWENGEMLARIGAIVPEWIRYDGEWWRLVTAMFLHGNGTRPGALLHVMLNGWAVYQLGTLYEAMFGSRRFLLIYFATGIFASLTSFWRLSMTGGGASVGASGAVFGLLGAFVFSVYRSPLYRGQRFARGIVAQCVFLALANLAISAQIPQVDNAAHIGGLVAGLVFGAILPHRVPPPPPRESVIDVAPREP